MNNSFICCSSQEIYYSIQNNNTFKAYLICDNKEVDNDSIFGDISHLLSFNSDLNLFIVISDKSLKEVISEYKKDECLNEVINEMKKIESKKSKKKKNELYEDVDIDIDDNDISDMIIPQKKEILTHFNESQILSPLLLINNINENNNNKINSCVKISIFQLLKYIFFFVIYLIIEIIIIVKSYIQWI